MREAVFIALAVLLLLLASRWGDDPHPLALPADCEAVKLRNPCELVNCNRVDPKEIA